MLLLIKSKNTQPLYPSPSTIKKKEQDTTKKNKGKHSPSMMNDIQVYTADNAPDNLRGLTDGTLAAMCNVTQSIAAQLAPEWEEISALIGLPTIADPADPDADILPMTYRTYIQQKLPVTSNVQRDLQAGYIKYPDTNKLAVLQRNASDSKKIRTSLGTAIATVYFPGLKKELYASKRACQQKYGPFLIAVQTGFADEEVRRALASGAGLGEGLTKSRVEAFGEKAPTKSVADLLAFEKDFDTATVLERWAFQQLLAHRLAPITAHVLSCGTNHVSVPHARQMLLQTVEGVDLEDKWDSGKMVKAARPQKF